MSAASVVYFFGHSLHLNFFSTYGVCLGPYLSFLPGQVGICFCWLCLLQNVPSHLGHPKGEHRPRSSCICHQTMYCSSFPNGGHQLSMCQKCTGAGASFCAGSCSACKLYICHCFLTFYHTQNMPTPVWHVVSHVS